MNREFHKWRSSRLGRQMELVVFGHAGQPVLAFPTSGGRYFDFEDRGVVAAVEEKIGAGRLRLICLDSVDMESWYNRHAHPWQRVRRHAEYERYVLDEVVPMVQPGGDGPGLTALGVSFGGYHAVNIALRHPDIFTGTISLSGAFDLEPFLGGYYDQDCYFHLPTHYLPNLTDPWYLDRIRQSRYVLATGWNDQCLGQNRNLHDILDARGIPHRFDVWEAENSHDWPTWRRMAAEYL